LPTHERRNVVASADASGTIRERYRYTVYGDARVVNADFTPKGMDDALSPFLWGGSYRDAETGCQEAHSFTGIIGAMIYGFG